MIACSKILTHITLHRYKSDYYHAAAGPLPQLDLPHALWNGTQALGPIRCAI